MAVQADQWRLEAVVSAVVVACGLVSVLLAGGRDFGLFFGALLIAGGLGVLGHTLPRLPQVLRVAAMAWVGPWHRAEARLVSSRQSVVGFPGFPVLGPALFVANQEEL